MSLTVSSSPSPFVIGTRPITETNDEIRAMLAEAELPPLLPALACLTGDLTLLRPELRPEALLLTLPQGGLTDDQQSAIRDVALATLIAYRDGGCVPAPRPGVEALQQILEFAVGGAEMAMDVVGRRQTAHPTADDHNLWLILHRAPLLTKGLTSSVLTSITADRVLAQRPWSRPAPGGVCLGTI